MDVKVKRCRVFMVPNLWVMTGVTEGCLGVEKPWESLVAIGELGTTLSKTLPKPKQLMPGGHVFRGFERGFLSTKRLGTTGQEGIKTVQYLSSCCNTLL